MQEFKVHWSRLLAIDSMPKFVVRAKFRMQFFAAAFLLIQDTVMIHIYITCYSTMMLYFILFDYIISYYHITLVIRITLV